MKALLAWAVLSLSIMGGFTARAEAVGLWDYQVYFEKSGQFVWCGTRGNHSKTNDVLVGNRVFSNSKECLDSYEYQYLKENLNDKPYNPDFDKNIPKKNPLLEDLGPRVVSVDTAPAHNYQVRAFVTNFEENTGKTIDRDKIFFGKIKDPTVGLCYMDKELIILDKEWWNSNVSVYSKEELLYHELGHCYYKRQHNDEVKLSLSSYPNKSCPNSIMHPQAFSAMEAFYCFHLNRTRYFKELKTTSRKFIANVVVYKWTTKEKWKPVSEFKKVANNFRFNGGGYRCMFNRFGITKKDKHGYQTENFKVACTKDNVNWIHLFHRSYLTHTSKDFRKGYSTKSRYSSELWANDPLTGELFSISLEISEV